MSDYIFVFDLDSTITKKEILPEIARLNKSYNQMAERTKRAMAEDIPFEADFPERVKLLSNIDLQGVAEVMKEMPLNDAIAEFIIKNRERCRIVTGNLDVWIAEIINKLDMHQFCYSSKAEVYNNKVVGIESIVDKVKVVKDFAHPFIAIGDGSNDAKMIAEADIGIGFGGVKEVAGSVKEVADYLFYCESELVDFLGKYL